MSSTKKPHEQTWKLGRGYEQAIPGLYIADESGCVVVSDDQIIDECMPLIACAPEMARMLLELEWTGETGCLLCGQQEHVADCALDTVLRKAGVR